MEKRKELWAMLGRIEADAKRCRADSPDLSRILERGAARLRHTLIQAEVSRDLLEGVQKDLEGGGS